MLKQFIGRSAPMHMFVRKFNEFQMDQRKRRRCILLNRYVVLFFIGYLFVVHRIIEKQQMKVMELTIND